MTTDAQIDPALLLRFEQGLNPVHPERSAIPARVLGYGEISTVLEIDACPGLALKRMPMFHDENEATRYEALYADYLTVLEEQAGLHLPPSSLVRVPGAYNGHIVLYIIQEKLSGTSVGNRVIHTLSSEDVQRLVEAVRKEARKVFDFNRANQGRLEIGLDSQISNWAIPGFDPSHPALPQPVELIYLDTSTPLMRKNGVEQLNTELFLRSAPSFLRWLLRWLFLDDVVNRYYDERKVTIDLIANFYKEQSPELVPPLVASVNNWFGDNPLREDEIRAYYREDALIWRLYLAFRRIDRRLFRLLRKNYPYILPGKIQR